MIFLWVPVRVTSQDINLLEFAKNSDIYYVEIIPANGINTPSLEFSPAYFRDGLVFVQARVQPKNKVRDKEINTPPFGLFFAPFNSEGLPINAVPFSDKIVSDFHLGPVSFNKAQDKIFFSRNDIPAVLPKAKPDQSSKSKQKFKSVQKLYQADLGPEGWFNIEAMPFNNDTFFIFHPAVSSDSKRIYFTSNMPGGFGDTDIYYVERIGNNWSPPINAGPEINTAGKEAYPFIHDNGDLYFASNGHPGLGGFDLFVSKPQGKRWTKPVNLGAPINTRYDDFGICISPNGYEGFFSSNRSGGKGKDDIYKFKLKLREDLPYTQFHLTIMDKEKRTRIDAVPIRIYELTMGLPAASDPFYADKDHEKQIVQFKLKEKYSLKSPDQYSDHHGSAVLQLFKNKKYVALIQHEGYIPQIVWLDLNNQSLKVELEPLKKITCTWINGLVIDKHTKVQLKDVAVAFIDKKGMEGQAFKTNAEGQFNVCVKPDLPYEISLSKAEYNTVAIPFKLPQLTTQDTVMELTFELEKMGAFQEIPEVSEGKTIVLNNIYYDYNQYSIRKDATKELDELASLMIEYPSMEIELIAHTDSRGDWLYNQKLSLQRAIAAKEYLVSKNIHPDRIRALGYGESQIRNHCFDGVPCSEEDHQYNRRTEVRIIKLKEKGHPIINAKETIPDRN